MADPERDLPIMKASEIRDKFGGDYVADDRTFTMGIDHRFAAHFAGRFQGLDVLETCTGAGFTTIFLAWAARRVITVEVDPDIQQQAVANLETAGLSSQVTFLQGDILDPDLLNRLPPVNAAFLDPDWAVTGPAHVFRFRNSNTRPPADRLLRRIFTLTENVALVLPPRIDVGELDDLPAHERESLFLGDSHALFCLYFGRLLRAPGPTEFRIPV